MTVLSFDDVNGNGITRDAALDTGDTFDARNKNVNYGGTGGSNNALIFYQGTGAAARKVGSTGGFGFTVGNYTSRDTTAITYRNVLVKMWITNIQALNPAGIDFCIGSGTGAAIGNNQHFWTMADDGTISSLGFEIPAVGGWIIKPVDVTLRAFRRGESGTPVETAMVNFGAWVDLSTTGGTDQNLLIDSPDYIETGFHAVGGTSTDPEITFQDFVGEDEGSGSTNFARVGLWRTVEGVIYWFGKNVIGRTYGTTVTQSEFDDSFQTLVCPGGYVREGFNELEFDIGNASTTVLLDNVTILGRGRASHKLLFDSTIETSNGDVDEVTDEINYTGHGLLTADQVQYSLEGNATGVPASGITGGESQLVTGTTGPYYYAIRVTDDTFSVATTFANALAGTAVALTARADETHSFILTPDTRYDFTQTGSSGSIALTNCNLTSAREITLDTNGSINNSNIITCGKLFLQGATMDGNTIVAPSVWNGEAFLECTGPQLPNIDNCSFTGSSDFRGPGHAIEVTSATDISYGFAGNLFTGYAAYNGTDFTWDGTSATIVNSTTDAIEITSHPYTVGEAVYYEDNGGTAIGGLTDGGKYYIEDVDANHVALHTARANAIAAGTRIGLTASAGGTTHRLDSANAAIWNNSGSSFTLSISGSGDSPSVRNTGAVEVTVESAVTIRVEGVTEGTAVKVVANETAGTITVGDTIFELLADSNGVAEISTFNYEAGFGAGLDVIVRARQQGLPNAAIADDNSSFTDQTTSANSSTNDDMTLLPASPIVGQDSYLFGHAEQFGQLKLDISQAGTGIWDIQWQYWNGAWTALSGVTDGTTEFTIAGENVVSWTIPGDWATTTINSQGPYFYVRGNLFVSTTHTAQPLGRKCKLDVTRYLPFAGNRTIISTGLTVVASWVEDTIATF